MTLNQKLLWRTMQEVLQLPTAPLHEDHVAEYVRQFALSHGLVVHADRFGNLLVRNRARGRVRLAVTAHMDHPGVVVESIRGRDAVVRVRGGLCGGEVAQLQRARICFFPAAGGVVHGRMVRVGDVAKKQYHARLAHAVPAGTFGMLDIKPVRRVGDQLRARAIDNIANCAVVLDWLRAHARARTCVLGVFTRAEEIGFVGAAALVRSTRLPRGVPIVVLEASSAPGGKVAIGGGPVLRVGDKFSSFDPRMDLWLRAAADGLAAGPGGFAYQRALMAGGTTEASLYRLEGYLVGSIILPLGNYHNRGRSRPAPEIISWRDTVGLRRWLDVLVTAPSVERAVQAQTRTLWQRIRAAH
ncbi:MAG: hypothetical protein HY696_02195 [Deltaproteobacteria bacterium]|nr:hypothetical protein [Deltaproteobacteria bacterium]